MEVATIASINKELNNSTQSVDAARETARFPAKACQYASVVRPTDIQLHRLFTHVIFIAMCFHF